MAIIERRIRIVIMMMARIVVIRRLARAIILGLRVKMLGLRVRIVRW